MTAPALTPAEVSALFAQGSIFAICRSNVVTPARKGRPPGRKITNYGATRDMARRIASGEVTGDVDEIARLNGLNVESLKIAVWRFRTGKGRAA